MPNKTHIYFVPGLAASSNIFDYISLPKDKFELHFLEWIIPDSPNESLEHYTKRLCKGITHPNPVLLGVSFGGIIVQEMSKFIHPKKIVLISSVKNSNELPKRLKILELTKAYKLFPTKKIAETKDFSKFGFNKSFQKKAELYNKYLNIRDKEYLDWAIYNMLHWKSESLSENIIHIHGDEDSIFPIKYIKNCIVIKGGTHAMIINKAKKINTILQEIF